MPDPNIYTPRRNYSRWVANQTLEDYALRFTAKKARRWSMAGVATTALGSISFLALEAIGGALTLLYGFDNTVISVLVVSAVIFLTGLPICYYAARYGVDIDLLSRGAGFGYIGSTITSLIYASFTFIFFALEAAIMASALQLLFDLPLTLGYLVSALVVIPLATFGITFISRFQMWSQPLWLLLQIVPLGFILYHELSLIDDWTQYQGTAPMQGSGFNLIYFGAASAVLFSLIAQIGEQVDFLRFMPEQTAQTRTRWWLALLAAGPGWIVPGVIKILVGSFLAVLAIHHGVAPELADDPTHMYLAAFNYIIHSEQGALILAGVFVILSQLKINVTNAYAGSIAWSNFFSRITRSHPGRVVWLIFNVIIALMLMQLGVYEALENVLGIYSIVAVAWVGALVADLTVNKPLGISPKHIEFKRAHLYDINPVGFGAMLFASCVGIMAYVGSFNVEAQALAPFIALLSAFILSPLIAMATRGRYYIARAPKFASGQTDSCTCSICQNEFESEDMASCPVYEGAICSLCCSIDSHCQDQCKQGASFNEQLMALVARFLPHSIATHVSPRLVHFSGLAIMISSIVAMLFWLVYLNAAVQDMPYREVLEVVLIKVYLLLLIIVGVLSWLFVLASESRQRALDESKKQTDLLIAEIKAHKNTDLALQRAKETAEAANLAKTRYLTGISHELRTPLNSIMGYTQLLEKDERLAPEHLGKVSLIHRSSEYLAALIEGLLDISRIEAGRMELHRDRVALGTVLNDLNELFSLQAHSKQLDFQFIRTGVLPEAVLTDEKHLRQILINLLSNAVKYTERGGVTFAVKYRSQVAEFTISDTGVGLDESEVSKIFEPFERIRKPGMASLPGTGLGLTISKFLAEIMGGEISVSSQPNVGSQFKLSLMLPQVNEPLRYAESPQRVVSYQGEQKIVMTVDDNPSHRGIISELLSPLGFIVLESPDAQSCLDALEQARPDLFLLDISMPGMDGWELLETLRQSGIKAPILMLSANAIEADKTLQSSDESRGTRHDGYLIKPIRDSLLLDKIAQVLNLQWTYEATSLPAKSSRTQANQQPKSYQRASHADYRELISMAQLGYVDGLNKIIQRLAQSEATAELAVVLAQYSARFQFSDIISISEKALEPS